MKAKVIKSFIDLKSENKVRKEGETIDITIERFNQVNKGSYGPFLEKINEEKKGDK